MPENDTAVQCVCGGQAQISKSAYSFVMCGGECQLMGPTGVSRPDIVAKWNKMQRALQHFGALKDALVLVRDGKTSEGFHVGYGAMGQIARDALEAAGV